MTTCSLIDRYLSSKLQGVTSKRTAIFPLFH